MIQIFILVQILVLFTSAADVGDECGESDHGYCEKIGNCLYLFNQNRKGYKNLYMNMTCDRPAKDLICCPDKLPYMGKRIYGGKSTLVDQYPYMVRLEFEDPYGSRYFDCSAILIHEKFVLTAAHCLTRDKLHRLYFGDWDTSTSVDCASTQDGNSICNQEPIQIQAADVIIHERYQSHTTSISSYDIALIVLNEAVKFTRFIFPIEFERTYYKANGPNDSVTIVGWGQTENQARSSVKQHATIKMVDLTICKGLWMEHGKVSSNLLCAGEGDGVDSCKGDSGGPAIRVYNKMEYLVGIIILGPEDCGKRRPGLYLHVYKFISWISEQIEKRI